MILEEVPHDKKIAVLKVVRKITGLDLKDSKDLVESAPIVVIEGRLKDELNAAKNQIEEAGGKVSVRLSTN
ncbi:MAG: hypothetical protein DCF20_14625 [Pseudanabaena sp.]|nr:MAG: hypothetical protein DCF20_14625 [Pseudanabaena sp.]